MKALLLSALLFAGLFTSAQNHMSNMDPSMMPGMSLGFGVDFQKFDGLNQRIASSSQYELPHDYMGVIQLGMFKNENQFVHQSNFSIGSSTNGDRSKKSTTIRYFGASTDFGYDFVKNPGFAIYPLVGLGVQWYQARLFRDNSGTNFDNVLQAPELQSNLEPLQLKNFFFNYRLGLGISGGSAKWGTSVGVQGIYNANFNGTNGWHTNNNQMLANAPRDKLSQFYVGVVFTWNPLVAMKQMKMEHDKKTTTQ